MKKIPLADLLRAELRETKIELGRSDRARHELRTALDASAENVVLLGEMMATMIHRSGEAGVTINDVERAAAWEACWLRVSIDILADDDGEGSSVRASLLPPTVEERFKFEEHLAAKKLKDAEPPEPKLKLVDP